MCFGPSIVGAWATARLESGTKKLTPHCVCRPLGYHALSYRSLRHTVFTHTPHHPIIMPLVTEAYATLCLQAKPSTQDEGVCIEMGDGGVRCRHEQLRHVITHYIYSYSYGTSLHIIYIATATARHYTLYI